MKTLSTLFFLSLFLSAKAQLSIGVIAGPNTTFFFQESQSPHPGIGFQIAGNVNTSLNKDLSLVSGIQFTLANYNERLNYGQPPLNTIVRRLSSTGYLEIPVAVKLSLFEKFYVLAGPKCSFLIYDDIQLDTDQAPSDYDKDWLNNSLWSLRTGVGYNLSDKFNVEMIFDLGLSDVRNNQTYNEYSKETLSVLQLNCAYKINLQKATSK